MENKFEAIFYPTAIKETEKIFHYIAIELCNKKAALKLIEKIESAVNMICIYPEIGRILQNEFVKDKSIRKYAVCNHIIFYKVIEERKEIHIVAILNKLRNYIDIL